MSHDDLMVLARRAINGWLPYHPPGGPWFWWKPTDQGKDDEPATAEEGAVLDALEADANPPEGK